LTGDPGALIEALNAFRASQGQPAVTGTATESAGSCALHSGDAPYCAGSYYWMPVSGLNGNDVVTKIAAFGQGRSWLLDSKLSRIAVGWAEITPTQYACTVVNIS
jgi:hypothetical protein